MWYFYGQYWSIMVDLELISINWLIQDSQMQEGSDPCANIGKVRVTFLGHLRPKPSPGSTGFGYWMLLGYLRSGGWDYSIQSNFWKLPMNYK